MRSTIGGLVLAGVVLAVLSGPDSGTATGARPQGTVYVIDRREDRVLMVDAASGEIRIARPRGLAKCGQGLHVAGGKVAYVGRTGSRSFAFALDPARPRVARKLGGAHELVPSRTPGRVWLAAIPRCRNVRSLGSVREITVEGEETMRSRSPVPGFDLVGAVEGGLVLQRHSGRLVAWDPASGRILWRSRRPAFALAAGGRVVASCPLRGCRAGIRLSDVADGSSLVVRRPLFRETFAGALTLDGSILAVPAGRSSARRLALVDTETSAVNFVPGSRLDRHYPTIAWAPSGWLFLNAGKGRLMAYRPGAERAVELPARLRRPVLQMAAG